MTFTSLERMPLAEVRDRAARLRRHLTECRPDASGMLIFSRPAVYYLSGAWVNGLLWLPLDGEPVLLCRRGFERAEMDSPLQNILEYKFNRLFSMTCWIWKTGKAKISKP